MQGGNRRGFTAHANTETILLTDEIIPPPALVRAGLEALPAIIRDRGERASAPDGSQPKCRRASIAIRTRVHGVSKNFGSGCEPEYLTIASHSAIKYWGKYWGAGRSTTKVSFSISSLPRFANKVSRSAMAIEPNANRKTRDALRGSPAAHPRVLHYLLSSLANSVRPTQRTVSFW